MNAQPQADVATDLKPDAAELAAWSECCQNAPVTTAVLLTTAYVLSPDRQSVLLLHRDKRPDDVHFGKYIGLGGHVDPGEDFVRCIRREVAEESGLHAETLVLRGSVLWTGFGRPPRDLLCYIFRVDSFSGEHHGGNDEGTLEWVPLSDIKSLPMWDSDHEWLPMVFDDDPRQFHGIMPYQDGQMVSWAYERI